MRDYLIINGKNLMEFGLYAFGNSRHKFPERDVDTVEIPGRTGNLTVDKGRWKNIEVEYSVVLLGDGEFKVDELRAFLLSLSGYVRIESTFEPEFYRMGRLVGTPTPKAYKEAATLTLAFDCMPQKFLKSGEEAIPITDGMVLYNPTAYIARPLLTLNADAYGTTYGTITVSNHINAVNLSGVDVTLDIDTSTITDKYANVLYVDCETKMAYLPWQASAMDKIEVTGGDFPKLMPKHFRDETLQMNGVKYTAKDSYTVFHITRMDGAEVTPRWWTL